MDREMVDADGAGSPSAAAVRSTPQTPERTRHNFAFLPAFVGWNGNDTAERLRLDRWFLGATTETNALTITATSGAIQQSTTATLNEQ